jgi:hypothetical protein
MSDEEQSLAGCAERRHARTVDVGAARLGRSVVSRRGVHIEPDATRLLSAR